MDWEERLRESRYEALAILQLRAFMPQKIFSAVKEEP
jgi:hypothetical protein